MVATAVLSTAVVGLVASFAGLQVGLQVAKGKTFASNLAMEKMQILKQMNYYQILVTPSPSYDNTFNPPIPYDTTYFPQETILEGGVTYTRSTLVQSVIDNSGTIVPVAAAQDTGMRLITVTISWQQAGQKKQIAMNSIIANPYSIMSTSIVGGTVKDSTTNNPIQGALVDLAENLGWQDWSNATGVYQINPLAGSYTLIATAQGYFQSRQYITVASSTSYTNNFLLEPMGSGTVAGTVWIDSHVVISQVVTSTIQAQLNNMLVQYVELFNPTPSTVTIASGGSPVVTLNFYYYDYNNGQTPRGYVICGQLGGSGTNGMQLNYTNSTIAPNSYYIIANTTTFMVNGVSITADAVYSDTLNSSCYSGGYYAPPDWNAGASPPVKTVMRPGEGGYLWLATTGGAFIDGLGWSGATYSGNTFSPWSWALTPTCYPNCYPITGGPLDGMEFTRFSTPTWRNDAYGRAYNSGYNYLDFSTFTTIQYQPFSTQSPAVPVIAGVPAVGAVVSINDNLSANVKAVQTGWPPIATFTVPGVATTSASYPWTLLITSGAFTFEDDYLAITTPGQIVTYPSSTTILNQVTTHGFIAGVVKDTLGNPISVPTSITVTGGGVSQTASINDGRYLLRVNPGNIDVVANPNNANASYVSVSSLAVTSILGEVNDGINFVLSQGGRISGWVTRDGVNALPGVAVTMFDAASNAADTEVTDVNGRFTSINMATGTYYVTPTANSIEYSNPTFQTVTVTGGLNVFSASFTITGALGTVSGNVTLGGSKLTTGTLIVVTTSALAGSPPNLPSLSSASLTGAAYYVTSSKEDGTFTIDVRQSTNPAYNVYGYYETVNPSGGITIQSQTIGNVQVLSGSTTVVSTLAW